VHQVMKGFVAAEVIALSGCATLPKSGYTPIAPIPAPSESYARPPAIAFDRSDYAITLQQMSSFYDVPGEAGFSFNGGDYGFESLSFIMTETQPGGGPPLHKHDTEEAHVVYFGQIEYVVGDRRFKVDAPYVVRIPAGMPHTFMNVSARPVNVTGVFPTKVHSYTEIGPNPLVRGVGR